MLRSPLMGLIPACAGKTHHHLGCDQLLRGSSPRVRGKLAAYNAGIGNIRLIPACAGKTRVNNASTNRVRAHPRVCGENSSLWIN